MSNAPSNAYTPALTVAIPFFNPGVFFLPALQSVFAQTFADWELLLIDDGGTDGAREVASRIRDDRVRVIVDGKNRGLSYRLNQAAHLARGEYLFRMDADDIMHPDRLTEQLAVLQSCPQDAVVGTASFAIDAASKVVGWRPVSSQNFTGFAARHTFDHPTVAAHTAWFKRNPYSELAILKRCEDAELWCRTSTYTDFRKIPKPLLFYREQGVFSLDNYLNGQKGILYLIQQMVDSRPRRVWLGTLERGKMTIAWALNTLQRSDLLIRHRHSRLDASEQRAAQEVLTRVLQTPFPLQ